MTSVLSNVIRKDLLRYAVASGTQHRTLGVSAVLYIKSWRQKNGLPGNRMSEGPLTDLPDYTFLDGRPTPLLHKQKLRMLKQRDWASRIVQLTGEIDFAIEREKKLLRAKEEERRSILDNRLKPKGAKLSKQTRLSKV